MHRCTLDVLLWGALERIEILVAYSVHIRSKFECYVHFTNWKCNGVYLGMGWIKLVDVAVKSKTWIPVDRETISRICRKNLPERGLRKGSGFQSLEASTKFICDQKLKRLKIVEHSEAS